MLEIKDKFGRQFQSLRVSLTNVCNMRCVYCVPQIAQKKEVLHSQTHQKLAAIVINLFTKLNLQDIRITGGEPTVYPYFIDFLTLLNHAGVTNIKITTNGLALEPFINQLPLLGITEINFSLDSLEQETFYNITKQKDLAKVLANIDKCLAIGLSVKVNTVLLKGINDHEILPILSYFKERKISVRFLELMRMGHLFSSNFDTHFIGQEQILETIANSHPLKPMGRALAATAQYWQLSDGYKFGIIANESVPFCNDCNRLRIDSKGHLYGCLSKNDFVDITDLEDEDSQLTQALTLALTHKQTHKFKGSELSMLEIGG
jgi:GTP 3',8-cyclase